MGLLIHMLLAAVHLFIVATDIVVLFLLGSALSYRWQPHWLMTFNTIGKPAVDVFTGYIQRGLSRYSKKPLSQRALLVFAMLLICFVRESAALILLSF